MTRAVVANHFGLLMRSRPEVDGTAPQPTSVGENGGKKNTPGEGRHREALQGEKNERKGATCKKANERGHVHELPSVSNRNN